MKFKCLLLGMFLVFAGSTAVTWAQTAADQITAGNQAYAAKDYAKALSSYQAAVQLDPNSAQSYMGIGNCYYGMGQKADALAAYQKSLQINPQQPQLNSFVQALSAQVNSTPLATAALTAEATPAPTETAAVAAPASSSVANTWQFSIGAGVDILGTGFNTAVYSMGVGGGFGGAYVVDENWSIWLNLTDYYLLSSLSGVTDMAIETVASGKYTFSGGAGDMKPYLLAGVGLYTEMLSVSGYSASTSNLMAQAGLGLQFPLSNKFDAFIEAKSGFIFATGTTAMDIPINAGVILGL